MRKRCIGGIHKMNKYLNSNYSVGSILERANYRKNEVKPYKVYGSIIERRMENKNASVWQRIKRITQR